MLKRLENVEATFSAQRLADEDKIRRADAARLRQFIPTVDVYVHSQSIADQNVDTLFSGKFTKKKVANRPKNRTGKRSGRRPQSKGRRIKVESQVLKPATKPTSESTTGEISEPVTEESPAAQEPAVPGPQPQSEVKEPVEGEQLVPT